MRTYGPYEEQVRGKLRYKVIVREIGQKSLTRNFSTKGEAEAFVVVQRKAAEHTRGGTVKQRLVAYRKYMTEKGNKARTIETTISRLTDTFRSVLNLPISQLTPEVAQKISDDLRTYRTKRDSVLADDTRMNMILGARTFGKWCCRRKFLKGESVRRGRGRGQETKRKAAAPNR